MKGKYRIATHCLSCDILIIREREIITTTENGKTKILIPTDKCAHAASCFAADWIQILAPDAVLEPDLKVTLQ